MLQIDGVKIEIGHFPDATLLLKGPAQGCHEIEWKFENNEELIALYFITKHLQSKGTKLHLMMKYIPNARQDRTHSDKDIFTLKYFAEMINDLHFESVSVLDAHSNVALTLFDRIKQLEVKPYIEKAIALSGIQKEQDILFYPDEGSQKRYANLIQYPHAFAYKKRRWEDGEILGLEVMGAVPNEPFNVLIIDDICSFGGTFYYAAKKLKELGANKIYLYVTHCENSILQGELIKSGLVEQVYTTDSLLTKEHECISILS